MINVLLTGANGFIGKNLQKQLNLNTSFNVMPFTRNDSMESLEESILKSDFIVHLAGEVRPDSSKEAFKNSNVFLTETIVKLLKKHNKVTPIIMASTIHAKLLKNAYGQTKREAELIVEAYAREYKVPSHIYRLPHVFGEACKPNYNSVVSTWMFNSIQGLEINVFDRDIKMNYVYVQDVISEFMEILSANNSKGLYVEPSITYDTTLGQIVDFLEEFKNNILNENYKIENSDFKAKMFRTYQNYYREENVK